VDWPSTGLGQRPAHSDRQRPCRLRPRVECANLRAERNRSGSRVHGRYPPSVAIARSALAPAIACGLELALGRHQRRHRRRQRVTCLLSPSRITAAGQRRGFGLPTGLGSAPLIQIRQAVRLRPAVECANLERSASIRPRDSRSLSAIRCNCSERACHKPIACGAGVGQERVPSRRRSAGASALRAIATDGG